MSEALTVRPEDIEWIELVSGKKLRVKDLAVVDGALLSPRESLALGPTLRVTTSGGRTSLVPLAMIARFDLVHDWSNPPGQA